MEYAYLWLEIFSRIRSILTGTIQATQRLINEIGLQAIPENEK